MKVIGTKGGLGLKTLHTKQPDQTIFLQNTSGKPEIVLIFPITRENERSLAKWKKVLEFVANSEISILLVVDKTKFGSATDYFLSYFDLESKSLVVLPRKISDTLFDSVGEIVLDRNMWIIQLHDDDLWEGAISLPETCIPGTVYYGDFNLSSETKKLSRIQDYSIPNRIVFSLVPSEIWNRFSKLIQDQKYHVAGSFDFILNLMAQLTCEFQYRPGFEYFWKDDNWNSSRGSVAHLTGLAVSDGWKAWSSPEIANFNRTIDCLSSLNYVTDLVASVAIGEEVRKIIYTLTPSIKRKLKYKLFIPALRVVTCISRLLYSKRESNKQQVVKLEARLSLYIFITKTWQVKTIADVIEIIQYLELREEFEVLQWRFLFWKQALAELNRGL